MYAGLLPPQYRYFGWKVEPDAFGTKMYCFGFWFFHVYVDSGDTMGGVK